MKEYKHIEIQRIHLANFKGKILGKVIKIQNLIHLTDLKKRESLISKITISDASGCIEFFSNNCNNIHIGHFIQISKVKIIYYRSSIKIIGNLLEVVNYNLYKDNFKIRIDKNYSNIKYRVLSK
nr:CMESO_355 [Cryptomonas sp.]